MVEFATREEWLTHAIEALWPYLYEAGAESMPKVRISVGFPKGTRGSGAHRHGQCFAIDDSADATSELFISPELDDPSEVLDVLTHHLIHAALGPEVGHGAEFGAIARAVGFLGKLTATEPAPELSAAFGSIAAELGPYPHAQLHASTEGALGGPKKQGTRMLKVECDTCNMVIRTTQKWIDNPGLPTCACGGYFHNIGV